MVGFELIIQTKTAVLSHWNQYVTYIIQYRDKTEMGIIDHGRTFRW